MSRRVLVLDDAPPPSSPAGAQTSAAGGAAAAPKNAPAKVTMGVLKWSAVGQYNVMHLEQPGPFLVEAVEVGMPESEAAPLAEQLAAEFGDVLPPALIATTVAAAWRDVPTHDDSAVQEMARTDVTALAEAVSRSSTSSPAA